MFLHELLFVASQTLAALNKIKRVYSNNYEFADDSEEEVDDPMGCTEDPWPKIGLNLFEIDFIKKLLLCQFIDENKWYCPCGNRNKSWRKDNNLDDDIVCGNKSSFTIDGFITHLKAKGGESLDSGDNYHYDSMVYLQNLYPGAFGEMILPVSLVASPSPSTAAVSVSNPIAAETDIAPHNQETFQSIMDSMPPAMATAMAAEVAGIADEDAETSKTVEKINEVTHDEIIESSKTTTEALSLEENIQRCN